VGAVLQLRLQTHVAGAVERQRCDADDRDQQERHIGQNEAGGVTPQCSGEALNPFRHERTCLHRRQEPQYGSVAEGVALAPDGVTGGGAPAPTGPACWPAWPGTLAAPPFW